ncbi:SDR family oxidoreductase [Microvirga sp. BT688]|jgi:NAD(P)-dependent dehydrogenase (short-subunit alcohol dehydrogenase family)|uniref:SDR family NAD(P)-dependent oxidoreductase n=1 Tax=Microvirga sp. TaxID=1873136 RepID=UPI001688B3BF|nr:SDR family NAD(P)-dependent oxidoreductase [Microvirga sp.]MBD2749545.1 SDR family oxidoreductase [Microvirga sp.]
MSRLEGKRAIITGAASGIGRSSALLFAAEGARVLAVDRNRDSLAELFDRSGGAITPHLANCDVASDIDGMVSTARDRLGGIDIVFANAGINGGAEAFLEQTVAEWEAVLRTNLIGTFRLVQQAALAMLPQRYGSIICTASVAGMRANAAGAAYSASKAGVISLVQTAASALGGTGLRINAICPGLIETGMTRAIFERAASRGTSDKIGQLNPLRRAGHPDEVAEMALFLASDSSSYVNGQAIAVDGGLSSMHPTPPRKN